MINAKEAKAITTKMVKEISNSVTKSFLDTEVFPAIRSEATAGRSELYVRVTSKYSSVNVSEVKNKLAELGYSVSYYAGDYMTDCYFNISW